MGLVMSPGSVISQLDSMNENLQQAVSNAETMLLNVNNFLDTGDSLKGKAYDSIRDYFGAVHVPTLNALILCAEAMIQENNTYKNCISSYLAGVNFIDEDGLKQDKEFLERQIDQAYSLSCVPLPTKMELVSSLEKAKGLIEKELQQINDFMEATAGLYGGMDSYIEVIQCSIDEMGKQDIQGLSYKDINKFKHLLSETLVKISKKMYDNSNFSTEEVDFINTLCAVYGFDEETAQTMTKLYRNLRFLYGNHAPQSFFALMASFSYGEVEGKYNAILWGIVAHIMPIQSFDHEVFGIYGISEEEFEHMKRQINAQHLFCEMPEGSDEDTWKNNTDFMNELNTFIKDYHGINLSELSEEEKQQIYKEYLIYCNRPDFTHMCATSATILYNGVEKELGNLAGLYNGIFSVEANAGYVGDVYGTNGVPPTMTNDDYMSDLDAVNISNRIENNTDMMEAMSEYYIELESGQTNRAKEFKCNMGDGDEGMGLYNLITEANRYYELFKEDPTFNSNPQYKDLIARFIISLTEDSNCLRESLEEGSDFN